MFHGRPFAIFHIQFSRHFLTTVTCFNLICSVMENSEKSKGWSNTTSGISDPVPDATALPTTEIYNLFLKCYFGLGLYFIEIWLACRFQLQVSKYGRTFVVVIGFGFRFGTERMNEEVVSRWMSVSFNAIANGWQKFKNKNEKVVFCRISSLWNVSCKSM